MRGHLEPTQRRPKWFILAMLGAGSSVPGCGCGTEQPADEIVYITDAQFGQLSAKTGSWDCMDLCALQNNGLDSLSSCEVSYAGPAAGVDDTGMDTAGDLGGIWLVTCSGTQRMLCY